MNGKFFLFEFLSKDEVVWILREKSRVVNQETLLHDRWDPVGCGGVLPLRRKKTPVKYGLGHWVFRFICGVNQCSRKLVDGVRVLSK